MKKALYLSLFLFAALVFPTLVHASELSYKNGDMLSTDTTWEGKVIVDGVVFVPEGVTLTIRPGATVLFVKSAATYSEEGVSEVIIPGSGLRVEGKIIAVGEKGKEITFTSAEKSPAPGDWGCIFIDHAKGSVFTRCTFAYSAYTIHAHFSSFDVSRCIITHNEDGSRLGICRTSFDHCDITDNTGKGLNFRQCKNTVTYCNITGNQDGIFLNEKDTACVIENNNIYGNNGMDLRLGEFHTEDVTLGGNYWGSTDLDEIKKHIYDKDDDSAIGAAHIEPLKEMVTGTGVDGHAVKVLWKFKTGGFVDCSPAIENGVVYFGSWDKNFYAVKAETGELVWKFTTGDCVDSSPAISDGRVFFGSWDRNIYCLDIKDGKLVWKFTMPPSNFDDHRQASPVVYSNTVYIGGFNGIVYAIDEWTGALKWEFPKEPKVADLVKSIKSEQQLNIWEPTIMTKPIRSKPCLGALNPSRIEIMPSDTEAPLIYFNLYIGSEDGNFYALNLYDGKLRWQYKTDSAINSSPVNYSSNIYFGCRNGFLYCLNEWGGKNIWEYNTLNRIEYSSPIIAKYSPYAGALAPGVLIGDCNGTLHMVTMSTGKPVWTFKGEGGIYSSPQLAGGKVVYSDNAGVVYWLNPETGAPVANFRAGDAVQGLSADEKGVIYAGSRDGYLYALTLGE